MPGLGRWSDGARYRTLALHICLALAVYAVLLLPTIGRQGISWDEQTDLLIARSYLSQPGGWFIGSQSDPSQARLPMAVVAVGWALSGSRSLYAGRLVSCLVGALALVGIYQYCARDFSRRTGLIACLVLSTSPFYLSFARVAFTETDVYVACAFAWLLLGMSRLRERGTVGWALFTAAMLGLAISAKFTAVVVLPAVALELWVRAPPAAADLLQGPDLARAGSLISLASASTLDAVARVRTAPAQPMSPWFHYLVPLLLWGAVVGWGLRHRGRLVGPRACGIAVPLIALGTFALVPPTHLTNRAILDALLGRFRSEMGAGARFVLEAGALHAGSVLFKSSLPLGAGMLLAPVTAVLQARRRPALRLPLLVLLTYAGGLVVLPIAQTFYAVPLLPILAVLVADQFGRLALSGRALAGALVAFAVGWLVVDLVRCYPDYSLNGYQYVGSRMLFGRSSIGYRSIVQTPSDGVEQLARWLGENVGPGERVAACVNPWHIVREVLPDPSFALADVRDQGLSRRPDYLVTQINCEIRHGWGRDDPTGAVFWAPYDRADLMAHYAKIGSVQRAFGLEVASIWQRR